MSRVAFALLVVVGVLLSTAVSHPQAENQQCPPNQEWNSCGSACPPTCANSDPHRPCTLQCIIGCQCKEGFLLNSSGDCVTAQNC